jgi:methyl-accepting chemotaxis protein
MAELHAHLPGTALIGSSTAGEFDGAGEANGAVVLFALAGDYQVRTGIGSGLRENVESAVMEAMAELPPSLPGYAHATAVLFIDGLAGAGEEATLLAAAHLGAGVEIAGAAAGDDWQVKSTFVGVQNQAVTDGVAVALIYSNQPLGIGVAHGHRPFSETLRITRASGNIVHEIEGLPAWRAWADATRHEALKVGIDPDRLGGPGEALKFFARFEAGVAVGSEYKIRPPFFQLPEGSLGFTCGIAEGTEIRLMRSTPELQLNSAREAARRAASRVSGQIAGAVVFDCACRKVLLQDDFFTAVRAVADELGSVPLAGFESYGEIALNVGDYSGFHNATSVVLAFPR